MQCQGTGEGGGGTVGKPELFCRFLHDGRKRTEVNVANVGEQVVFNLVIEAATQPRKYSRPGAEVGRGFELVRKRIVFHFASSFRLGELHVFKHVCGLENACQRHAGDGVHHRPSGQDHPKRHAAEDERQADDVTEVQRLRHDHFAHKLGFRKAGGFDKALLAVTRQRHPVFGRHPENGHDSVEEPGIDKLQFVHLFERTFWAEAQDARGVDVFVQAVDVREAVVQNVVLDFPHGRATTDQVEDLANHRIHALVGAEGAVVGVVHDVQTDAGQPETHDDLRDPELPACTRGAECDQSPRHKECSEHHGGFEVHAPVALAGFSGFLEIRVNARSEGFAEVGLGPIEANDWNLHEQV